MGGRAITRRVSRSNRSLRNNRNLKAAACSRLPLLRSSSLLLPNRTENRAAGRSEPQRVGDPSPSSGLRMTRWGGSDAALAGHPAPPPPPPLPGGGGDPPSPQVA